MSEHAVGIIDGADDTDGSDDGADDSDGIDVGVAVGEGVGGEVGGGVDGGYFVLEDLTRGAFGHCQSLPSDEGARGKKKRELTPSSCQGTRRRAGTRWRRSSSFSDPLDVLQTVLSLNLPRDFSSIDIPDAACLSCELFEAVYRVRWI